MNTNLFQSKFQSIGKKKKVCRCTGKYRLPFLMLKGYVTTEVSSMARPEAPPFWVWFEWNTIAKSLQLTIDPTL